MKNIMMKPVKDIKNEVFTTTLISAAIPQMCSICAVNYILGKSFVIIQFVVWSECLLIKWSQMDYLFYILTWIACASLCACVKVSFYGASHIAMPLQEAKISTNIRLRFRTHQDNAFILLAAGRTDYCLLGIDGGRVKFHFKVDDFMAEVLVIHF